MHPGRTRRFLPLSLPLALALFAASSASATGYANQLGWTPTSFKTVVLTGSDAALTGAWSLVRASGGVAVASGTLPASKSWAPSGGDPAIVVRLPDSLASGTYQLKVAGRSVAPDLAVLAGAWIPVSKALLKGFYYQRAGIALEQRYAGQWSRAIAHQTGYASYHSSSGRTTGGRNSPKGWYDAGDYNKYSVNSGISVWNLLALAENHPDLTDTLKWGIPEEGSGLPDLLAEARWNLDWMLTMQDDDGGIFHKWTQKKFGGFELPDRDTSVRWMVGKSVTASYDFAAVMAQASRVWVTLDPAFSATTLEASKKAWAWANAHPTALFSNPADIATGSYDDSSAVDEKLWASAELAAATGDQATYLPSADWSSLDLPWWKNVGMLAAYTVVSHPTNFDNALVAGARQAVLGLAGTYADRVAQDAWASPQSDPDQSSHSWGKGDFPWGSNSILAHMGIQMLYAWHLTGDSAFLRGADASLDHLLGRNPLGLCNVTGFGTVSPLKIHHRISGGDAVTAPVPGLIVGGPYGGGDDAPWSATENWKCKEYRVGGKVALDWLDDQCSYATNEIAINWNASAAHLASALSALHQPGHVEPAWSSVTSVRRAFRDRTRRTPDGLVLQAPATVELRAVDGRLLWRRQGAAGESIRIPETNSVAVLVAISAQGRLSWAVAPRR